MKQNPLAFAVLALGLISLTSCEAIEGIFKVGFWAGAGIVILIIALIVWLFSRFRR